MAKLPKKEPKSKAQKFDEIDREEARLQTSYDSIASAASALGIPVATLRRYKKMGAPGFRGSRVYPLELLPWIQGQKNIPQETKDSLDCAYLRIRIERQKFFFDCDRKEFVRASDVHASMAKAGAEFVRQLDALPAALAPEVVGLSVADAEFKTRMRFDEMKRMLYAWCVTEEEKSSTLQKVPEE